MAGIGGPILAELATGHGCLCKTVSASSQNRSSRRASAAQEGLHVMSPSLQYEYSTHTFLFARRSSEQLNSATDEFCKHSSRSSWTSPAFLTTRTSSQKLDTGFRGAAQLPARTASAAAWSMISPGRRSSSGTAGPSMAIPESSEDQGFPGRPKDPCNHLSQSLANKSPPHRPADSSFVSPSLVGSTGSTPEQTVRLVTQTLLGQPKIKLCPPSVISSSYPSNSIRNDMSPANSSETIFSLLNNQAGSGRWADSNDWLSLTTATVGPLSDLSIQGTSPRRIAGNIPRSGLSGSPSDVSSTNSSSKEMTYSSSTCEDMPQKIPAVSRTSRKYSGPALSSSKTLDRLHQHLEEQVRDSGSISQKPLGPEEAARLRDKLKEQKLKSMQAIHRRLFQHRRPYRDGDDFSCAVEPDSLILGEFIVHQRVGVGKYIGMRSEIPPGKVNPAKYIFLKYADGVAKLNAKQAHQLLYRYHLPGEFGRPPSLSKLKDPSLWEKRKSKGKIAVQKMVVNMMELYIHRLKQSRPPYPKNLAAIAKFAAHFPYAPTPDQLQAFADVERDMTELDRPMDRLICGDVGFGKTEVALRAIFITVEAGKQVMVLAPSTVLAKQHYETIRKRFASFPAVKVALLCRFQKDSAKKDVILGIHDGSLSIVVGTHSLLGSQIRYHNLGLLVIDEEQRFGVKQKEKITCLKTSVDVLTLSATPIPRTLYLALSGLRDASLLTTAPPERRPIQTHLVQYNEGQARAAIQFELDRGGQVFYVVPRVKGIEKLQQTLEAQFPDIEFSLAHGKQSPSALEDAMEKFCEGQTRILLCTNIIESGLDIRMVNTIIVEDVQHFGLAQLYQLRGRVGRAHREAHAYLFHPHKSLLTSEALERLVALQDCCNLGQGMQLAERDMAIRGIGSLFGEQQSGDAAKIGSDLYFEMLLEGLSKVGSQRVPLVEYDDVQLDRLAFDKHIPSDYIKSHEERVAVVRNAEHAARESLRALVLSTNRLRDKYGKEPASMEMLLKTIYIRRMAADLGIHRIRVQRTSVLMETNMTVEAFEMIALAIPSDSIRSSLTFESGYIEMQGLIGLPQERQMERIFCCLSEMFNGLPSFLKHI